MLPVRVTNEVKTENYIHGTIIGILLVVTTVLYSCYLLWYDNINGRFLKKET